MFDNLRGRAVNMLRWSEKYTKTDMVYLASSGSLSVISQGVTIAASLGLAIAVGHVVPPAMYGEYKYVVSVITILSFFSLSGLGSAVTQSVARGFGGTMQKAFWINLRWSGLVFLGALGLGIYYFAMGNTELAISMLIGGFLSPFLASANLYASFLAGEKDFVRQIIYATIENAVPILIFIGIVFITTNPIALVATYFLGNTLATLYYYGRTIQVYRPDPAKVDTSVLGYSKHLSVMNVLGGISDNIDQVLLFHFVGAAQLAVYNFATALPDQIKGPMKTVDSMLFSGFTRRETGDIKGSMRNKILWLVLFTGTATILYLVLAPYVFEYLFPTYVDAVFYSRIYALWMISASFDPANMFLMAKKKIREQYVLNIGASLFLIVSVFVGAVEWGILGVIVARLITKWVAALLGLALYANTAKTEDM